MFQLVIKPSSVENIDVIINSELPPISHTVNHVKKSCHIKSPWSEFIPRLSKFVIFIKSVGSQCVCQNFIWSLRFPW